MATHRGIESAWQAVVELLRYSDDPGAFNRDLEFRVLAAGGFEGGLPSGVSVFLYRVMVADSPRRPPGRRTESGEQLHSQSPSTSTSSSPPGRPRHHCSRPSRAG